MTWSYSGDPSASDLDAVRFLIGDTDTTDQQVSNEEIAWALTERAHRYGAAADLARRIAAKYARKADMSVGDLSISYSQRQKHYADLATELEIRAGSATALIFAGGLSIAGKKTYTLDTDQTQPTFIRDQFKNLG